MWNRNVQVGARANPLSSACMAVLLLLLLLLTLGEASSLNSAGRKPSYLASRSGKAPVAWMAATGEVSSGSAGNTPPQSVKSAAPTTSGKRERATPMEHMASRHCLHRLRLGCTMAPQGRVPWGRPRPAARCCCSPAPQEPRPCPSEPPPPAKETRWGMASSSDDHTPRRGTIRPTGPRLGLHGA